MPLAHHTGPNGAQTLFFAHVPKTGGSSVEDYLIQRFGRLSLIDENKRDHVPGTGLIVPATHLAAGDLKELLPPDLSYSFAVVRDPLKRVMSEYRYQAGISQMSRLGFSAWLRVMVRAAAQEPRLYHNHIRPQTDLVPEGAEVFKLEDGFAALIARLDDVTGTHHPDVTVPHINTRKTAPITLSRDDVAAVSRFYAADYARFGYPLPEPGDYPETPPGWKARLAGPLATALIAKQRRDWVK